MKTFLIILLLLVACSSKPPQHPKPSATAPRTESSSVSIESQQLAAEEETKFVTEVVFRKSNSTISAAAKNEIRKLILRASKESKIDEVKLVTWGDIEYPSVNTVKLSDREQNLVDKRNQALQDYIASINKNIDVEKVSMAERPSWINRTLSTDDARIKKSLETNGIPNTDTSVKSPAMVSSSIIIVTLEK